MRDTHSLWLNSFTIISLLIASLGMCECGGSLGVTHPATFTHWPASESHSLPQFILLYLLLPNPPPFLPINLLLPSWCFSPRIKNACDFPFYPFPYPIRLHTSFNPSVFPTSSSGYCSLESFPPLFSKHLLALLPGEPMTEHISSYTSLHC